MKILIVPSWYPTKSSPIKGIFFKEQAAALQRAGHHVAVAVFDEFWTLKKFWHYTKRKRVSISYEDDFPVFRLAGFNVIPTNWGIRKFVFKFRMKKIFSVVKKNFGIPDVIHAHGSLWAGYAAGEMRKHISIPLVLTEHTSSIGTGALKNHQLTYVQSALLKSDKIIAVSQFLKNVLSEYVNESKILVIPNMIDTKFFIPAAELTVSPDRLFRFFSLGLLTEIKGMDVLIKAFSQVKDLNVELHIGGDGPIRRKLEQLAEENDLHDRIKFLGEIPRRKVPELMQGCDAFILASRFETFGIVYIEALACGKPIIATNCGGPDMIVNKNNGFLVPTENVEELADAMRKMVQQYNSFNKKLIREDCIKRFSEKTIVASLEEIYHQEMKG